MDDATKTELQQEYLPEEIFTDEQLQEWARRTHAASEIFNLRELKSAINDLKYYA